MRINPNLIRSTDLELPTPKSTKALNRPSNVPGDPVELHNENHATTNVAATTITLADASAATAVLQSVKSQVAQSPVQALAAQGNLNPARVFDLLSD